MLKGQDIIYREFDVDVVNLTTVTSLALTIFRTKFYDDVNHPIHIPTRSQDQFLREGAKRGGHSDVYEPRIENGYYYDVNSLYPYAMKKFPMPIGKPWWEFDLKKRNLDELFGFVYAFVVCPDSMNKPFLTYRDPSKPDSLIHPTGQFFGVYFTEELKHARKIGYKVGRSEGVSLSERRRGVQRLC